MTKYYGFSLSSWWFLFLCATDLDIPSLETLILLLLVSEAVTKWRRKKEGGGSVKNERIRVNGKTKVKKDTANRRCEVKCEVLKGKK